MSSGFYYLLLIITEQKEMYMKFLKLLEHLFMGLVLFFTVNMDTQSGKRSVDLEPSFAPLQAGQGSFIGEIHDGSMAVEVEDLSFFGTTSLGHIKSEDNDSVCEFDLAEITQLEVIQPHFDSCRFSDQVFTKVSITTLLSKAQNPQDSGQTRTVNNLLVPRNIIVCGRERATGIKRAWFINKINKILVHHTGFKNSYKTYKSGRTRSIKQESISSEEAPSSEYHQEKRPENSFQALQQMNQSPDQAHKNENTQNTAKEYFFNFLRTIKELVIAFYHLIQSIISGILRYAP